MYEGILVIQTKKSPMNDRNEGTLVNPLAQSKKSPNERSDSGAEKRKSTSYSTICRPSRHHRIAAAATADCRDAATSGVNLIAAAATAGRVTPQRL